MASKTLKGTAVHTIGFLPTKSEKSPGFQLTKKDLSMVKLIDYEGSKVVLNIFPGIDENGKVYIRN